jgi:hypothetical protein
MHLTRLRVQNFRSIENIEVEFDNLVSVIVGPNAVGKTTVLEAIRLAKGLLAPRTQNETLQTLISLGAATPHLPQQLNSGGLSHRPEAPLIVKCAFKLADSEIETLGAVAPQLARIIALQSVGQTFVNPSQNAAFFSSLQGQQLLHAASKQVSDEFTVVKRNSELHLNLSIDFQSGIISGENPLHQSFYAALEQALEPGRALFSYFPADRAMPLGENPVQLGAADAMQQLESYSSQPQLKYNRLKNLIFNSIVVGSTGRADIERQFEAIFSRILRGRRLGEIGVNKVGMLSIPIVDTETGRVFDIDGLSSGEKGLILTFLLIAKSIASNGLLLLDEPELHLNPAVCRDLLQFLVDEFAEKQNIQAIICSHSAEILAGAFEREACSLFHLRGPSLLAKVRQQDRGEIRDALRRLGSSESEALLYKGTVSVEGIHDVEVLRAGFEEIFRRYKLKELGGRGQVEKDIAELQKAEKEGGEIGYHFFIFDHDGRPTSFSNTDHVRVTQLSRHCLENFLIESEVITDLSRNRNFSEKPFATVTETQRVLKDLALQQVAGAASREVFREIGLEAVGFDVKVLASPNPDAVASGLMEQISRIRTALDDLDKNGFVIEFKRLYATRHKEIFEKWDDQWQQLCNGKKLFEDLRKGGYIKGDLLSIKKQIASEMSVRQTENWRSLESALHQLVKGS